MKEKPQASIDGKEVEVEFVQDGAEQGPVSYKKPNAWRSFFPIAIVALIVISVTILSATLFIWALPILLPILIVLFVVRLIR